jgi:hypothetical protein
MQNRQKSMAPDFTVRNQAEKQFINGVLKVVVGIALALAFIIGRASHGETIKEVRVEVPTPASTQAAVVNQAPMTMEYAEPADEAGSEESDYGEPASDFGEPMVTEENGSSDQEDTDTAPITSESAGKTYREYQ